jgi:4-amino-4-deoxy-L-arabinose transferase-like glycosyltransferase
LLLPFALWWIHRARLWRDRNVQLALWWFFTYFAFLTLAVTKRQIYFLPAYPAAAILLAPWISSFWRDEREEGESPVRPSARHVFIGAGITVGVMAVIALGLLGAVAAFPHVMEKVTPGPLEMEAALALRAPVVVSALVLLAGMAWVAAALWRRNPRAVLVRLGVAQLPLYLVVIAWLLPAMDPAKTYAPQGDWIRAEIGESERFGVVGLNYRFAFAKMGAFGYYTGAHVDLLVSRSAVQRYLDEYPGSAVLVHEMKEGQIIRGEDDPLRGRIVRDDLHIGRHRYTVLRGGNRPVP